MRAFVVVLALIVLACQQQPRYKLETRGGQTLRVDTQTGETARLENGAWVPVGAGTAPPQSTGLPDADLAGIRVGAKQVGLWDAHIVIDNNTRWNLTSIAISVAGKQTAAPIRYGTPLKPGERMSFTATLPEESPAHAGTELGTTVLSASGH